MLADSETVEANKPDRRRAAAPRQTQARSKIGNGKALLAGIDQRTDAYRQFQDIVAANVEHLGGMPTELEMANLEDEAGLRWDIRRDIAAMLRGEPVDRVQLCTKINAARRLRQDLGLAHRIKDVTTLSIVDRLKQSEAVDVDD